MLGFLAAHTSSERRNTKNNIFFSASDRSYNGLGIGDKIREKHSVKIDEWEKNTGRKMRDDLRKDVPLT